MSKQLNEKEVAMIRFALNILLDDETTDVAQRKTIQSALKKLDG